MNYKKRIAAAIIATLTASCACLAACGGNKPEKETPIVPVDKSDLPYVSALDGYKKTDWSGAKWVWTEKNPANSYVALRKSFNLAQKPAKAILNVSAESKYWLWVNGELTVYDGSPKRGATAYDAYYEQVDISNAMTAGDNTLAFMVAYNGRNGTSSVSPGKGGLLFELDLGDKKIVSDSSVKVQRLTAYRNEALLGEDWPGYKQAGQLAEWNVYYDASYATSEGEFYKKSFNDGAWTNATEVARAGEEPFNDLYLSVTPLIDFDAEYTELSSQYTGVKLTAPTTITVDLPQRQNLQFSPYFELSSETDGARFTYYTNTYETQGIGSFKDDYVAVAGEQKYESYPWRSGSQLIIEAPAGITFNKIAVRTSKYATEKAGSFESDNAKLNTLWQKAYNTLLICMRDTYMDCPERERSPYLGDSANQISETFYCMDENAYALTKKTILNTLGWTKTDNAIPLRSPGSNLSENPGQTLAFLVAVYEYYLATGDAETVRAFYPAAINYLKLWDLNADGTVKYRNGSFVWVDWGDGYDQEVLQNCWYYYALTTFQKLASSLQITADDAFFAERAGKIKTGFAKFRKDGGFASGTSYDDRANAMAVLSGLADESDYENVKNVLTTVNGASPFMEKYVLEALCVMGEYEACITRMLSRYTPMIDDVDGTLWEVWDKTPSKGTMNHGWSGGPLTVLSKYYGGISSVKPGYEEYQIVLNGYFGSLQTSVHTLKGDISYALAVNGSTTTVTLNAINAKATLKIPESMGTNVSISGGAYTAAAEEKGFTCFTLTGGGTYTLTIG